MKVALSPWLPLSLLLIVPVFADVQQAVFEAKPVAPTSVMLATQAAPKNSKTFLQKHESFLARAKEGPIELLFLGDSITELWKSVPNVFEEYFGRYKTANFGIGGDRTQHVLWRIENGELDGIRPKVVVFLLGTNNSALNSAEDIAAADRKIIEQIKAKIPGVKVLLMAVFPRGPRKNSDGSWDDAVVRTKVIGSINAELAKLDDGKTVRFLDITGLFYDSSGNLPVEIMPDQLHLSEAGYRLWAKAMQPLLEEMMR